MREEGISVAMKRGVGGRRQGRQSVQSDHQAAQGGRQTALGRAGRERRPLFVFAFGRWRRGLRLPGGART